MRLGRAGFTVLEALVAIVLLALVGQAVLRLLSTSQRLFRSQGERAALQATVRAAAGLFASELRGAGRGDIVTMLPDEVVYRAPRLAGVACAVGPATVAVRRRLRFGYRGLTAGRDSLLLFRENDPGTGADDQWEPAAVSGPESAGVCPDGAPADVIPAAVPGALVGAVELPVRGFEVMQLRLYQSGGQYWIGSRSLSGGEAQVQPALGPLTANGLELAYRDGAGGPAPSAADVRLIGLTVRSTSDGGVMSVTGRAGSVTDSLASAVELRNAE